MNRTTAPLVQEKHEMNEFLCQVLAEMDTREAVLPADLYAYLLERDGACPYSLAEIEAWAGELECLE